MTPANYALSFSGGFVQAFIAEPKAFSKRFTVSTLHIQRLATHQSPSGIFSIFGLKQYVWYPRSHPSHSRSLSSDSPDWQNWQFWVGWKGKLEQREGIEGRRNLTAFIILLSHATHCSRVYRAIDSWDDVTDLWTASRQDCKPFWIELNSEIMTQSSKIFKFSPFVTLSTSDEEFVAALPLLVTETFWSLGTVAFISCASPVLFENARLGLS